MSNASTAKKFFTILTIGFLLFVSIFLFRVFTNIEWEQVTTALKSVSSKTLLIAFFLVLINYLIVGGYDTIGFKLLQARPLPYVKVAPTAAICYAFNFNLGSIIGGLGFRMRMYSGWNVSKKIIPFVALYSIVTAWVGYTLLLSLLLLFRPQWVQGPFNLPYWALNLIGITGLSLVFVYLFMCARKKEIPLKNPFQETTKKSRFVFPPLSIAFLQLFLSCAHWCVAASIIALFMDSLNLDLSWGQIFYTFMIASIGGVVARIPAGIGVLEAIFLRLQPQVSQPTLLAGLLCFRAVYYLLPLVFAITGYVIVEYLQREKPKTKLPGRQSEAGAR